MSRTNKIYASLVFLPCLLTSTAQAFDVVEAGQPVVTGEPSRVGPPWNHRSTLRIPGTQTDVAFGGYVKLDMTYDFDYDMSAPYDAGTDLFTLLNPANETDGRTHFSAYETRLNFRTHTRTDQGDVTTYFEGHFMPEGDFNIRHAYGQMNGFLAGQTWSNFMSFVGGTRTLALGDPRGYSFDRNPQLRYTTDLAKGRFSVALEDSETVIARQADTETSDESHLPDLTLRYEYQRAFAISALARELSSNGQVAAVDDTTMGYGVQAQASLPLGTATKLNGSVTYGSGIGNYMGNPGNTGHRSTPDVYLDGDQLEAVDTLGFGVSLSHYWSNEWFSSAGYSRLEQDLPDDAIYARNFDNADYIFVNTLWDVTHRTTVGLEYQYADVENVAGDAVDASRLMASAIFQF
ncbi:MULTISPECIES: DcaP family trimeric outer membrane transporter [unclassified Modicisalibacter]|uniref:DcaP family trimeric outer membrane transporter n=1 Tax=unclassified Modicisalibacter TaxID=2679913 RepID=UPI001CCA1DE4|nr:MULTISPECIES: DcaP family trimeric outer membrane transporter [unclassified Modicisalibacter]MBZ9557792.1 porin [Modicisalibacter sp. R2A 31.J]MBZ9573543.1 porin [Modicisalibacter sp. MOD 31.J]